MLDEEYIVKKNLKERKSNWHKTDLMIKYDAARHIMRADVCVVHRLSI